MNCIIIDDEPLAREAIQKLVDKTKELYTLKSFSNAAAAESFIAENTVDLIFLDIRMPGMNGIEFSKKIPSECLVIFTTAFSEYALESYEVEALDYLVKPIHLDRFQQAVNKAMTYQKLLAASYPKNDIEMFGQDNFFVKADRKFISVLFKEILFIEGLKDYVIIQTIDQRIITAMNIKTIHEQLPKNIFVRISKSYIINVQQITSFDNNTVLIKEYEVPIGSAYRTYFFDEYVTKKVLGR